MRRLLIVVDMQNDFISGALGTKEAVAIVPLVTDKVKGFEGEVIYTRDTHHKEYLSTQEGKISPLSIASRVAGVGKFALSLRLFAMVLCLTSPPLAQASFSSF